VVEQKDVPQRNRIGSSPGLTRPFVPAQAQEEPLADIAEALDHIARALSAIDHNLKILVTRLDADGAVGCVAASLKEEGSK
jgi:hypothetical protein